MLDCSQIVERVKSSIAFIAVFDAENKLLSTGSGFVFSKDDILVTRDHIVKHASTIVLKFPDSPDLITGAKVVIRDEEHDLALLTLGDHRRVPLQPADTATIKEGMPVVFSGYPFSIQVLTTHQGILSAIAVDPTGIAIYLIDGSVNSGNSGCPLMDTEGRVIGVINAMRREHQDLLERVDDMSAGAVSLHGVDLVEIYQALMRNIQLGVGYAVPASYIPEHKEIDVPERESMQQYA